MQPLSGRRSRDQLRHRRPDPESSLHHRYHDRGLRPRPIHDDGPEPVPAYVPANLRSLCGRPARLAGRRASRAGRRRGRRSWQSGQARRCRTDGLSHRSNLRAGAARPESAEDVVTAMSSLWRRAEEHCGFEVDLSLTGLLLVALHDLWGAGARRRRVLIELPACAPLP